MRHLPFPSRSASGRALRVLCLLTLAFSLSFAMAGCGSGYPSVDPATGVSVAITTKAIPAATVGVGYSAAIAVVNGVQPYTFMLDAGALPAGVSLTSGGLLTGTAAVTGSYTFTVGVKDATLQHTSAVFAMDVFAPAVVPVTVTTTSLSSGTAGVAYQAALAASGGTASYTFSVTTGSLPAGVTLASTGVLSGTPLAGGTYSFGVTATDSKGASGSANLTLTIGAAAVLVLTTPALGPGEVTFRYDAPFAADGGVKPYSFAVTAGTLPPGFTMSAAGLLGGTPTASGIFNFTVTVTDAAGTKANKAYSLTIYSTDPLKLTTPALGPGERTFAYTAPFYAANGVPSYTFAVTAGAVPPGFTFTGAGVLSGTPTAEGIFTFTITVTDAVGATASGKYSLTIYSPDPLKMTSPSQLGPGEVGYAYDAPFFAANGVPPYTFAVTAGSIPVGFKFATGGDLAGTPSVAATSNFTVTVTDAVGATASAPYSVTITSPNVLSITAPANTQASVGVAFSAAFTAVYGTSPYTYAVSGGSLPAGMTLAADGTLSGTSTAAGTYTFSVTVTDANKATASTSYTLVVNSTTLSVGTSLPDAAVGSAYSGAVAISGGAAPYTVTLTSGTLPAGLNLAANGAVSGTPTASGTASFTVAVKDSSSPQRTGSATVSIKVLDAGNTTVTVDTTTTLATIPQAAYGLFTAVYDSAFYDLNNMPALLKNTGTTMLRYPGGSYSDSYHWAQHIVTPLYADPNPACGNIRNGYLAANTDFGKFVKLMQATGTQAVITVNYGTSVADANASRKYGTDGLNTCSEPNTAGQPQEAAAWVAYANGDPTSTQLIGLDGVGFNWKTVGFWASLRAAAPLGSDDGYNFLRLGQKAPLGIKYWEVGNEMYYNGGDGNRNFEDDLHAPFVWPNGYNGGYFNSRDGVAALGPTAYGTNSVAFIQAMKAVDPTIKVGVDLSSPVVDPISLDWNPKVLQATCGGANFDLAIMHYYTGTYQSVSASEMLGNPQTELPSLVTKLRAQLAQYCPNNAANMEVVITETSPNGYVSGNVPDAVTGIFATNIFLSALQTGVTNIDWLEMHGGNFLDNNDNPKPAYYGIQMAHLLAGVGDKLVPATVSGVGIEAFASVKTSGSKGVLLVNSDASKAAVVQVSVPGASLSGSATVYSYGVSTTQSGAALVGTKLAVSGSAFNVTVPAYTAVVVVLP